jgi:hypothetical protein
VVVKTVEAMREIRTSGALVERHRRTLEELLTAPVVHRALQRLPDEQRREFLEASPLSWVRIPTLEAAFRELGREVVRDPAQLQMDVVRRSVEANMRSIWRIFLRLATTEGLVSRLPRIYARSFDGGEIVIDSLRANEAEFHVAGWPQMPQYARRGLSAGTEAVLSVAGRQDVRVKPLPDDLALACARFSVRWRK